ncbi:nickel pincer cofactor-dependent isomerase, group 22 [Effusibacillus pohliae]|uniref:lactate racemase domain-containing protein n=1 Tax=Effusibacillus pohliae TaxID=232270 RepID=UPI000381803D|nr:lactate racemase domain-containing protein [Effusibacillus pohliae]
MELPLMYPVRQKFDGQAIADVAAKVRQELEKAVFLTSVRPGATIAVTAGSRGIANIVEILRAVCQVLREREAVPFLVPSMGSHGGGTPAGQIEALQALGITEAAVGAPIRATTEVVELGQLPDGTPVFQNRLAYESDGIVVINRIKPHTSFKGCVESGLCKMLVVGLGNPAGAANLHRFGVRGLRELIVPMARIVLEKSPVLYGLGILENAFDQTAVIAGIEPADIPDREAELLKQAKTMMPRLPFDHLDVLIVDEMGKCYSGTGMDTNVIGRLRIHGEPEPESPRIERIVVLDLADASHGNANGIGLADFTTRKLVDKIDWKATYLNNLSSTFVQRAMIPIIAESDGEAVRLAIQSLGQRELQNLRIVRIPNTLQLERIWVSEALLKEVHADEKLELAGKGVPLGF